MQNVSYRFAENGAKTLFGTDHWCYLARTFPALIQHILNQLTAQVSTEIRL